MMVTVIVVVIVLGVYHATTTVRYANYRASISSLYCRLAASKTLPQGPVIVIPGIKGSTLAKHGHTAWLTMTDALHRTAPLVYAPDDGIAANGIFDRITAIPFFSEYRPYYQIAAQLACAPHAYLFWYDWRADGQTNATAFAKLVDRVIVETGQKPSMIAHSMGGLIAHSVVKEHPEKFNKIVYVTVPFNPGIGYLDDLNNGTRTGLNGTLLSKEAVFSQPSSFLLLPHKGSARYKGKELMDAQTWKEEHLSVFADAAPVDMKKFQSVLDATVAYQSKLDTPETLTNKFLFVVGNNRPVIFGRKPDGTAIMVPGDGRVAEQAAFPTDTIPNKEIWVTTASHGSQLNDTALIEKIFHFLSE